MTTAKQASSSIGAGALVGVGIAAVMIPFCFFAAGFGHGTYAPMIACFPFTMLGAAAIGRISVALIVLGVLQFPAYGAVVGWSRAKARSVPVFAALAVVHVIVGAAAAFVAEKRGNFLP